MIWFIETVLFKIGEMGLSSCQDLGKLGVFALRGIKTFFLKGVNFRSVIFQMNHIGVNSWSVVALTGSTIGAVLAAQAYDGLHRFGVDQYFLGPLVYLSMCREFGPIVSALMVIARAGSSMTAEIGSMKISEQVDALQTLSIDPVKYIVVPRILATTIIMPLLNLFCIMFGVAAGFVISVYSLGVGAQTYTEAIKINVVITDVTYGLIKSVVFGFLTSIICSYKGMNTTGGARGIGISTTQSVVYSCVTIFVANYILTMFLFYEGGM